MDSIIPLEDGYGDIVAKARHGQKLSLDAVAARSGLPVESIEAAERGEFRQAEVLSLALALCLDAEALEEAGRGGWRPAPVSLEGLAGVNTPHPVPGYAAMTVNAYLVWDPGSREAVIFDSGADATPLLNLVRKHRLEVRGILLTHAHGDHVAALGRLREEFPSVVPVIHGQERLTGADAFREGSKWRFGALRVEARLTPGHSPGGTTFVVRGLGRPVAVVGDALFAQSIGGVRGDWEVALAAIRQNILQLPAETVLCPGHGPMTTVAEERRHNPFFQFSS